MQEYGGDKTNEHREASDARERTQEGFHGKQPYSVVQKSYGLKEAEQNKTYGRVTSGIYESSNQQYQTTRYSNSSVPTFSSPPNSPLVGVVFSPSSPNYSRSTMTEHLNADRRSQSSWSISNQEPIGTGAKKKIVKSHEKRNAYSADPRYHERFKDSSTETEPSRKDRNLRADSTTSLDFFAEGEKMVSELCNIVDASTKNDLNTKMTQKNQSDEDKNKSAGSSEILLTALDKIIIHDQIPNQIVQLAIEACTDAENIAIAHHNRPCFKNIHSICAKTRSNVQKPDSAVANLHSQGIPWVIKNFIFSFVRILDGWKGVKELLSEKHDTFSRIENKYYSPNIRECFIQWQAITKEMLTHIYKTFKCLDHGFTMEQKSFTHNYYATNSAAPRHQNQSKFQPIKTHITTRPINTSPQPYNAVQPPWMQNQNQAPVQTFNESPWPTRPNVSYKKFPVVPSANAQNFYPLNDQNEIEYQKAQYKCDPYNVREAKPRQSWTITNVPDFRSLENMCHTDQRELYNQLRHKMDAELGKAPGQPVYGNIPCELMQRRDMELKAKMIPLSHVEKTLIPSMATAAEIKSYVQKNNSCGDTKDDTDFFAAWGQMVQKESNDFLTHHTHNIQIPTNVVTLSSNISGPVQFIDTENDEFHEMSKVYMKPGSYKVPIKPADPLSPFVQSTPQDITYDNVIDDVNSLKMKSPFSPVTLAPQPKYNLESWPCLMPRRAEDILDEEQKIRNMMPALEMRGVDCLDILSSMTSDRAWEAAKQSAPKLMDFLHDGGNKSDTARLYDALGLCTIDEFSTDTKQIQSHLERSDVWPTTSSIHQYNKPQTGLWEQNSIKHEYNQNQSIFNEDVLKFSDVDQKSAELEENVEINESKVGEDSKEVRCPNFDQSGNYIRDENHKKVNTKSKVAISGMWYHPKKKKPLPPTTVKKFEVILTKMSTLNEAAFIQHDMDIKTAPRFYEVVKYPMCLHDIMTKLKNSSYTEVDQVLQDFRRIFNNVKLYLKSYPDSVMKKNVNKVAVEFEKMLNEEFPIKMDTKKCSGTESNEKKYDKENDLKNNIDDKTKKIENLQNDADKK